MNVADLAYLLFLAEIPAGDTVYQSNAPEIWSGDPVLRGMYENHARQVLRVGAEHPVTTAQEAHHG